MPLLSVFKASAGSGKTWRLTVEYVKLLLNRPDAYRNTLAVTFTNKATAEMKERILNALWSLSHVDPEQPASGMTATLVKETGLDTRTIRDNAGRSLQLILHDYGRFRVETIDSYFQSILRNLARELGIGTSLNIELNNAAVLDEAVNELLDRSNEDPLLLGWITDYMEEVYREGKVLRIDTVLKEFGLTIFKEFFKEKERFLREQLKDKGFLQRFKKELQALQAKREAALKEAAGSFFTLMDNHGLTVDDFSNSKGGVAGFFIKLKNGECEAKIVGKRVRKAMEGPDGWVTKSHRRSAEMRTLVEEKFLPLLLEVEALRTRFAVDILTCRHCVKHLSSVGLLSDIDATVRRLNSAANRFLLSDTNALLSEFISGQDTSFVFEKTGAEINHILFDEFQDTSRLQWETFKPILAESLANGYKSLVVGDEKQAIYRWRNGDWRILGGIERSLSASMVEIKTLSQNWRSDPVVIDFNNKLFRQLTEVAASGLESTYGMPAKEIRQAYSSVEQEAVRQGDTGFVELRFLSSTDETTYEQEQLDCLVKQVESLQLKGVKAEQMAILVRSNKHISRIADAFSIQRNPELEGQGVSYDIISDEAFQLSASRALQLIITALRLLADPGNELLTAQVSFDYQRYIVKTDLDFNTLFTGQPESLLPESFTQQSDKLRQLPLHELVESLYQCFDIDKLEGQDSYLYTFMDLLNDYVGHHSSDLPTFIDFWDESLSKKSVPSGTGVNGIRILSIHKSKGLEFHTVFVPFCDWKMTGEKQNLLWCEPNTAPFNQLRLIPVYQTKGLAETIFSHEFKQETLQLYLDNINVLYVAFTRAKSNLLVFGKEKKKKTSEKEADIAEEKAPATISDLLLDTLKVLTLSGEQDGETTVTIGRIQESTETSQNDVNQNLMPTGVDIPVSFDSREHTALFRQSTRSKAFSQGWDTEGYHNQYIDRGKLYHRLFSAIRTVEDVDPAVNELVREGLLNIEQEQECLAYVQKALSHSMVTSWFSGRHHLFNECSILTHDETGHTVMKRPDRVMRENNKLTVVDFKFGKPAASHHQQVREYMELLSAMGYPTIEGFLWYVDEKQIVPVFL